MGERGGGGGGVGFCRIIVTMMTPKVALHSFIVAPTH